MDDTSPLTTPTGPPAGSLSDAERHAALESLRVTGQAELQRLWELLMSPLGFSRPSLWVTMLGPDDRPTRFVLEIAEMPADLTQADAAPLCDLLLQLLHDQGDADSVAFLLVRPGRDGLRPGDVRTARALLDGARAADLPCHPVHLATDVAVHVVAPDDLAA